MKWEKQNPLLIPLEGPGLANPKRKWVPMGVSSRAEIQCEVICVRTEQGRVYSLIVPEPVTPGDEDITSSRYEDFIILGPYTRSSERVRVESLPEAIQRIVGYETVDD